MRKMTVIIILIVIFALQLSGCDNSIYSNSADIRNPFIPSSGTPVPEPNAPLMKIPVSILESSVQTSVTLPPASTTANQISTANPVGTITNPGSFVLIPSTSALISLATPQPSAQLSLPPILETIPKIGIITDNSTNAASELSKMAQAGLSHAANDFELKTVSINLPVIDYNLLPAYISRLVDEQCSLIILCGSVFKDTLESSITRFQDTNFVLIEHTGIIADNVLSVSFSEYQAGFIAGFAAASEISYRHNLEKISFGIIMDEDTPGNQLYSDGFSKGINYATGNYRINATIPDNFTIHLETPGDTKEAYTVSSSLFNQGANCIFNLADKAGKGVIRGAFDSIGRGNISYVVGIDYDNYSDGIYIEGHSAVITSAMKYYDNTVYSILAAYSKGYFLGGTSVVFNLSTNGVGLPFDNHDLSAKTLSRLNDLFENIGNGTLTIPPLGEISLYLPSMHLKTPAPIYISPQP